MSNNQETPKPKVKWATGMNGDKVPFMFENHNGIWKWVPYTISKVRVPDSSHFSKGYLSFLQALKSGYQVEPPSFSDAANSSSK